MNYNLNTVLASQATSALYLQRALYRVQRVLVRIFRMNVTMRILLVALSAFLPKVSGEDHQVGVKGLQTFFVPLLEASAIAYHLRDIKKRNVHLHITIIKELICTVVGCLSGVDILLISPPVARANVT